MTDTPEALPPLPEPLVYTHLLEVNWALKNVGRAGSFYATQESPNDLKLFTADQMRDYARAALAQRQQKIDEEIRQLSELVQSLDDKLSQYEASAPSAQAEPVAWVEAEALQRVQEGVGSLLTASPDKRGFCQTPLYAAPPTAQAEPQEPKR